MAGSKFSDIVTGWVRETQERMDAVFVVSVKKTVALMLEPLGAGGNLPVDTGFLRASLVASPTTTPPSDPLRPNPGGKFTYSPGPVNLVIESATVLSGASIVFTANYAIHVEYGARGRPGRAFSRLAAQQWPQTVSRASRELEHRVKNG